MRIVVRKVAKSVKTKGVLGAAGFVAAIMLQRALRLVLRKAGANPDTGRDDFDRSYDVDTEGVISLSELDVETKNWIYGNRYEAIGSAVDFEQILRDLNVQYREFSFIDLGSGKGRALMLACRLPFRKVVGVEFSAELNRIANENLQRWPTSEKRCWDVSAICMNAEDYVLPETPCVIFLYNPFGPPVMERVIANVHASYRLRPRRMIVMYFTPKWRELWDNLDFLVPATSGPGFVVYDTDVAPLRQLASDTC